MTAIVASFQFAYNAFKIVIFMFSNCQPLKMKFFDVKVIDFKTEAVTFNLIKNQKTQTSMFLSKGFIYESAREVVESVMRNDKMIDANTPPSQ